MRRLAVFTLALGVLAAPVAAAAQLAAKIPRIGVLSTASPSALASASVPFAHNFAAFRESLRDLGYVEGQNLVIEWRWAEGRYDRLPELAAELVRLKVDVIVTHGRGNFPAKQATSTIPIVAVTMGDPVGTGLVASLARPGGNVTGLTWFMLELVAKRLEVLKEAVPRVTRVAVLFNPDNAGMGSALNAMEHAARALKVALHPVGVQRPEEFEGAFKEMATRRVDALAVVEDPMIILNQRRVAELAIKRRLPSVGMIEYPRYGGLLAYDADVVPMWRRAATFVDKILKGAKPGDLPVEQPTKFELVINLKTAKALGVTIPQSILLRADEVIQ